MSRSLTVGRLFDNLKIPCEIVALYGYLAFISWDSSKNVEEYPREIE
jgi:hypothetical protein